MIDADIELEETINAMKMVLQGRDGTVAFAALVHLMGSVFVQLNSSDESLENLFDCIRDDVKYYKSTK